MVRLLSASLVMVLALCCVAEDKKEGLDPAKLVGKWSIVSGMKSGNDANDNIKKADFEITKEQMILSNDGQTFKFKYTIDAKASPATVDLEMTESPFGAGMKAKGIISLDGEECKLCYSPMGEDRPKKFEGKDAYLFVMKKKK